MEANDIQTNVEFSPAEREAVYKCIFNRRDVRGQFLPNPIPDDVLGRKPPAKAADMLSA